MAKPIRNHLGGIDLNDSVNIEAAKDAGLVTFPESMQSFGKCGAKCSNCKFFEPMDDEGDGEADGFCANPKLQRLVNGPSQCCNYWDTPGVHRNYS